MEGSFVLVVGPSGAGKDTLIGLARNALDGEDRFLFPRRLVTRERSSAEDHDTIDDAVFESGAAKGHFALSWRAHGLGYAIPGWTRQAARGGSIVVCNVSRMLIGDARRTLPNVRVVEVTAPLHVLKQRLLARSRRHDGDLAARLSRSEEIGEVGADFLVANDGRPEEAAERFVLYLRHQARRLSSERLEPFGAAALPPASPDAP